MFRLISVLLAATLTVPAGERVDIQKRYGVVSHKIINAAMADDDGLVRREYLCDRIGNRFSGTESLERAIDWSADQMKKVGLENITKSPVVVPHWVRGRESAALVDPIRKPLAMIGLGMSVGTPAEGITADVIAVSSFDQLQALGRSAVAGKIVLFNPEWKGYNETVMYRTSGPSRAAELGAVGALARSMTGASLETPHTGALDYIDGLPKIPAAALSLEDTAMIQRLLDLGQTVQTVRVRLTMEAHQEPDVESHNLTGEIPGREKPEEVVVLGGHIDSWDVGQGANDDGSGIMAALEAAAIIKELGLVPRRTIRIVFWVNEENGAAGARAYMNSIGDQVANHVAAIEMDGGAEKPVGFSFGGGGPVRQRAPGLPAVPDVPRASRAQMARATEIGRLLLILDGGRIAPGGGGADITPLASAGVPSFSELTTDLHYFDWHHSDADSFDKIVPREFRLNVASLAVLSYVLADMPERLSDLK